MYLLHQNKQIRPVGRLVRGSDLFFISEFSKYVWSKLAVCQSLRTFYSTGWIPYCCMQNEYSERAIARSVYSEEVSDRVKPKVFGLSNLSRGRNKKN